MRAGIGLLVAISLVGCADGTDPATDTDTTDSEAPSVPAVCINEFMAANDTSFEVDGALPDWIELANPGTAEVSLQGWHLTDDAGSTGGVVFGEGIAVPAGGVLLLYADDDPLGAGGVHLPFKLSATTGDVLTLTSPEGLVDEISFSQMPADFSLGRATPCCQETSCWSLGFGGSPGAVNGDGT